MKKIILKTIGKMILKWISLGLSAVAVLLVCYFTDWDSKTAMTCFVACLNAILANEAMVRIEKL